MGILQAARPAAAALGTALAALGASPAFAQSPGESYPASRSLADVSSWLKTDTPLVASQVVDVGPSAVTAITASSPTGDPRGFSAQISAETLDPAIGAQDLVLSWSIPVNVDCDKRLVRLGAMTGYPSRDLRSAPRAVRDPDGSWVAPSPGAPLGAVLRALCDRDFKRPLIGASARVASQTAKPPKDSAAPAPEPKPVTPKPAPALRRPAAPGSGSVAVQVGASPSLPDAKGIVAKLQKKHAGDLGGLTADVATAQVDGKTIYRAVITGFHAAAEATALCEKLKADGQACFVRR